jgi:START domain-containing protein
MKKNKKTSPKPAQKKQVKAKAKPAAKAAKKVVKKAAKKVVPQKTKPAAKPIAKPAVKQIQKAAPKQVAKPVLKVPAKKFVVPPKPVPKIDEPKPKGLYSIEYELNSSPDVLFEFISTPGGLEKWFADRVYIIEGNFVFNWEDGEKRLAKQVGMKEKDWVRFHWLDEPEKRYFEFKIVIDDLTSEVALIVSDFADNPKELEESTRLWNQQINDLHHSIGSS